MSEDSAPYITKIKLNIIKSFKVGNLYLFKIEHQPGWLAVMHDRAQWITEDLNRPGLATLMTSEEYLIIQPLIKPILNGLQSHLSGKFDQYDFDVYRGSDGPAVVIINSEYHVQCLRVMAAYITKNFLEEVENIDWYIHYVKDNIYNKITFKNDFYNCTLKRIGGKPNVG